MYVAVHEKGFQFYGKVKDLPVFLAGYPLNITLQDLVRLNLH